MGNLLLGFVLGAMAFTAQGREIGNKIGNTAVDQLKKVMPDTKKPAEQSPGAAGNQEAKQNGGGAV